MAVQPVYHRYAWDVVPDDGEPFRGRRWRCPMRWFDRFVVSLLALFLVVGAPACSDDVKSEKWQKDLRELERQLAERHVNLFHSVSKDAFEQAVSDLDFSS